MLLGLSLKGQLHVDGIVNSIGLISVVAKTGWKSNRRVSWLKWLITLTVNAGKDGGVEGHLK